MLEYRILGPLEVARDGVPLRLGGPRQRATLALLLLHANRVVSIDRLADDLYAGRPPVTAVTQVQRQVSDLRKLLGDGAIETRPPGYLLRVGGEAFDLARFEHLAACPKRDALREALALWRGRPLADLEYEPFAQAPVARLEELRLAALEATLRLELEDGAAARVAAELEPLVAEHPLRERLRALQMLALERSGRHADALAAYREAHRTLAEAVGIEPSAELRQLERQIRAGNAPVGVVADARTVVVAARGKGEALIALVTALEGVDLVAVHIVDDPRDVPEAARTLAARNLPRARTAAFASADPASDAARLATANDAELLLTDTLDLAVFDASPATVGVVVGAPPVLANGVAVPFGGGEHEWAALELAAQLTQGPISLVGRRDASRLLADASLALQRVAAVDVTPEPVDDVVASVLSAGLVVAGVSSRWRTQGIGTSRRRLAEAGIPVLLVHRGPRPSMLAPREARTRFTWSLASA